ncbi:GTP cyclohydrolase I FolE [bacterium]|nr:GTP cyclohydrolase I FolE [bacterium]
MENLTKIESITHELLREIGEDPEREGLVRTPHRVAKAWRFVAKGYEQNLKDVLNDAIFEDKCSEMVVVRDIEFFSLCEHHLLPFFGKAHVAYIPRGKVIGLSKIPRILEMYSRRLQIQERITHQVAEALSELLNPAGVAVVLEGRHLCMQMRGVEKQNSFATTSAMLGEFHDEAETRAEFLSIINMRNL